MPPVIRYREVEQLHRRRHQLEAVMSDRYLNLELERAYTRFIRLDGGARIRRGLCATGGGV